MGWAVVEFDEILIDWGSFRGLATLERLLELYKPDQVLAPEGAGDWIALDRATALGVGVSIVSEEALWAEFAGCGAYTERERVEALVNQFPMLKEHAPEFVAWKREPERQAVFRALAIALCTKSA